jgi:hypothetical protein
MDHSDWLTMPTFMCRHCGAFLVLSGQKRPVSEFYAIHPKTPCPLSEDVVRLDSNGRMIEKLVEKGVTLER